MENKPNSFYEQDVRHWNNVLKKMRWIIAAIILVIEIVVGFLLHKIDPQWSSPENFKNKIFRYLILTTTVHRIASIVSINSPLQSKMPAIP